MQYTGDDIAIKTAFDKIHLSCRQKQDISYPFRLIYT